MTTHIPRSTLERLSMDRCDIPDSIVHVLTIALEIGLMDGADLYALAATFRENWSDLVDEIVERGYAGRHEDRPRYQAILKAAEVFWEERAQWEGAVGGDGPMDLQVAAELED